MKVVLLTDIDKLGQAGEMVTVKDGYARNFLIPIGMAIRADPSNIRRLEAQRKTAEARSLRELRTHKSLAVRLSKCEVTAKVQVGEEDRMFGAVTSADIVDLIDLPEPLKSLGVYSVPVKIHAEVEAHVKVKVVKEE